MYNMKKIVLISAFVLATLWGSAQSLFYATETCSEGSFSYGPKVGLNLSNLSIKDVFGVVVENPMKAGFVVGGFVNYRWGWFAMQSELLYSRQGTGIKFGDQKGTLHLDYINVPMLTKFYLWDNLSVEVGPQVGFLVGKKFKDAASIMKPITDFHSVDLAVAMGAAYDFDFGLTLDVRYNLGLINTIKSFAGHDLKSKNGVMQVTAGWNF